MGAGRCRHHGPDRPRPGGDDLAVRWVAVRHAPDHIHLVATLGRQDQIRPKVWNDYFRGREACQDAERRFGLRCTAPAAAPLPGGRPGPSRSRRSGAAGSPPHPGSPRSLHCRRRSAHGEEFFTSLAQAGVLVRRRYSTIRPGQVTGYAVGLPHALEGTATPLVRGRELAADLTLPKLRTRWSGPQARDPLAGADQFPHVTVRAVLRATVAEAAEHATDQAGFFARLRAFGVLVRERLSEVNPGEVTGYAVTLPGCTSPDGTPRWFGGGRLDSTLTLPRLRENWARGYGGAERSGASLFTGPEHAEIYRHAARKAATAAESCGAAPPATRTTERTLPGPWLTRSTLPPWQPGSRQCAVLRTPTTGSPAHRTAGSAPHSGGKPAPGHGTVARDDRWDDG